MQSSVSTNSANSSDLQTFAANESIDDLSLSNERYFSYETLRFPVGNRKELVYSKLNRGAQVFPASIAELLENCRSPQTLRDHARSFKTRFSHLSGSAPGSVNQEENEEIFLKAPFSNQNEPLINILTLLVESGWLVSETEAWKRRKLSIPRAESPTPIQSIGIITKDRVDALRRCLHSYIENTKAHAHQSEFVVMDDSDPSQKGTYVQKMLLSLKLLQDVKIAYAGLTEKALFAKSLIQYGDIPADIVNFALFDTEKCGTAIGANRNALLLQTVGEVALSVDDDTVCRIAPAPDFRDGISYGATRSRLGFWFYSDPEETLQKVPPVDKDLLAIHEQMLGMRVQDCLPVFDPIRADRQEQERYLHSDSLLSHTGSIMLTCMGTYGDAGSFSPAPYFWMNHESFRRLALSDKNTHSAWTSRENFRAVSQASVTMSSWGCNGGIFGFDNRGLLPPFMPVMRGEDALFGLVIHACFPEAYIGHLPWAVHHAPLQQRYFTTRDLSQAASRTRLCDLVGTCVKSFFRRPGLSNGREHLRALGNHLSEISSLPLPEFEEFLRLRMWEQKSGEIMFLEAQLPDVRKLSSVFGGNMSYYLDTLQASLPKDEYIIPVDLAATCSPNEARLKVKQILFKYGQLLAWWPQMIDTATKLREQGCQVAPSL